MKSAVRTGLSLIPLAFQILVVAPVIAAISFLLPALAAFLRANEGKFTVPAPTRVLLQHAAAAKLILLGLVVISAVGFIVTRYTVREEADRLVIQNIISGFVWYFCVTIVGGILMAAMLPYFAYFRS